MNDKELKAMTEHIVDNTGRSPTKVRAFLKDLELICEEARQLAEAEAESERYTCNTDDDGNVTVTTPASSPFGKTVFSGGKWDDHGGVTLSGNPAKPPPWVPQFEPEPDTGDELPDVFASAADAIDGLPLPIQLQDEEYILSKGDWPLIEAALNDNGFYVSHGTFG